MSALNPDLRRDRHRLKVLYVYSRTFHCKRVCTYLACHYEFDPDFRGDCQLGYARGDGHIGNYVLEGNGVSQAIEWSCDSAALSPHAPTDAPCLSKSTRSICNAKHRKSPPSKWLHLYTACACFFHRCCSSGDRYCECLSPIRS